MLSHTWRFLVSQKAGHTSTTQLPPASTRVAPLAGSTHAACRSLRIVYGTPQHDESRSYPSSTPAKNKQPRRHKQSPSRTTRETMSASQFLCQTTTTTVRTSTPSASSASPSSSSCFRRVTRGATSLAAVTAARLLAGRGSRRRPRAPVTTTAMFGFGSGSGARPAVLTSADVIPGQGAGSPKWPEMHDRLKKEFGVKTVDASDLASLLSRGKVTLVDVRQTIEYDEW